MVYQPPFIWREQEGVSSERVSPTKMKLDTVICATTIPIVLAFSLGFTPTCVQEAQNLDKLDWEIKYFHRRRSAYPKSLTALCKANLLGGDCYWYLYDSWGRPYSYSRRPGGYSLFSKGPDGLPGTEDDIWPDGSIRGCSRSPIERLVWGACVFRNCPCMTTSYRLLLLKWDITGFHAAKKRYPKALSELDIYLRGGQPPLLWNNETDGWWQPFRYHVRTDGYSLYSAGPDGVDRTDDDVFPGAIPVGCALSTGEPAFDRRAFGDGNPDSGHSPRAAGDGGKSLLDTLSVELLGGAVAIEAPRTGLLAMPQTLLSERGCSYMGAR